MRKKKQPPSIKPRYESSLVGCYVGYSLGYLLLHSGEWRDQTMFFESAYVVRLVQQTLCTHIVSEVIFFKGNLSQ